MSNVVYTAITFAPIQGFIEKSRKLRDLYGSSYILSFLSWSICQAAEKQNGCTVVSPALINVTQGMPNQIIIKGNFPQDEAEKAFNQSWHCVVASCREWIEENIAITEGEYCWQRDWQLWANHCWEFFWAQGKPGQSITDLRRRLNQVKHQRDWTAINWQGESSTLSGADAIAYPDLGRKGDPRDYNYQEERNKVRQFYEQLSQKVGESFINPREELSIPELIKRLITHQVIVKKLIEKLRELNLINQKIEKRLQVLSKELAPQSFQDLSRWQEKSKNSNSESEKYWTGWFLGDGDNASKYFKKLGEQGSQAEENGLKEFSKEMRKWGLSLKRKTTLKLKHKPDFYWPGGRMIYAGGDDFFGVLYYPESQLPPRRCLNWFYTFKSQIWHQRKTKPIPVSVGLVWAGHQVPQRDVIQHCREAERSAKSQGRDRIAFRILFNSGNYLEWTCPWWLLDVQEQKNNSISKKIPQPTKKPDKHQNLIESYRDREGGDNWVHFYQDVAILEARHAFGKDSKPTDIALALFGVYFDSYYRNILSNPDYWWNEYDEDELQTFTGILGDPKQFEPNHQGNSEAKAALNAKPEVKQAVNNWVINLAKTGFYLTEDNEGKKSTNF